MTVSGIMLDEETLPWWYERRDMPSGVVESLASMMRDAIVTGDTVPSDEIAFGGSLRHLLCVDGGLFSTVFPLNR